MLKLYHGIFFFVKSDYKSKKKFKLTSVEICFDQLKTRDTAVNKLMLISSIGKIFDGSFDERSSL
jgi:hypothetical protein